MRRVAACLLAVLAIGSARQARAEVRDYVGAPVASVAVQVEGRPVSDERLSGLVTTAVGRPLDMRDVRASLARLFSLSIYEDVQVRATRTAAGVAVRWRPFNLRAIMVEQNNTSRPPAKMRYIWRDLERRTRTHALPFRPTPPYPVDPELRALRVGTVAAVEGWCPEFSRAVFSAWMRDHKAPHENLDAALRSLEKNGQAVKVGDILDETRRRVGV